MNILWLLKLHFVILTRKSDKNLVYMSHNEHNQNYQLTENHWKHNVFPAEFKCFTVSDH